MTTHEWIEPAITFDRTTLERWSTCPHQARLYELHGEPAYSDLCAAGIAGHEAIGKAIADYQANIHLGKKDLAALVRDYLNKSRPDIQPEAVAAFGRSAWEIGELIGSVPSANVLKYDGGTGDAASQLARTLSIDELSVTVTSEIDLLIAGPSPSVLHEFDYKSGWRNWTARDVAMSFQFQLHWWLVQHHYPGTNELEVAVFDTRRNRVIGPVVFQQRQLTSIHERIKSTIRLALDNRQKDLADVEWWPTVDKCRICSHALKCMIAQPENFVDVMKDPKQALLRYVALEEAYKQAKADLTSYIDENEDILLPGVGFGRQLSSKPTAKLYKRKETE